MFAQPVSISPDAVIHASVEERMQFIRKVYGLLTLSLLTAVVFAYIGQAFISPAMLLPLVLVELVLVFVAMAVKRKEGWNKIALFAFTGVSGLTLAPVIQVYDLALVQNALLLTALIFGGLTLYVIQSKKDFSFLSGFLMVGLLIAIGGGLLNVFLFKSPAFEFVLTAGGVLLFSAFILYDTSNILRNYDTRDYTAATLSLYLDILNLFLYLLRFLSILGGRD